jgi:hypothetical protein
MPSVPIERISVVVAWWLPTSGGSDAAGAWAIGDVPGCDTFEILPFALAPKSGGEVLFAIVDFAG